MYNTHANNGQGGCGRGHNQGLVLINQNPTNLNQANQNNMNQQPRERVDLTTIRAKMNEIR